MNMASPASDAKESSDEIITINPEETSATAEKEETFGDPELHYKHLSNQQFQQDMKERKKYADAAFKLSKLWVLFLIGSTAAQMILSIFDTGLSEWMYVTLLTSTTVSVLGVWALVGSYLFGRNK